jgi:hypothetical protein
MRSVKWFRDDLYLIEKSNIECSFVFETEIGEKIDNIACMYTILTRHPFKYRNWFTPVIDDILKQIPEEVRDRVDYFSTQMLFMKPKELDKYGAHIGLTRLYIKI